MGLRGLLAAGAGQRAPDPDARGRAGGGDSGGQRTGCARRAPPALSARRALRVAHPAVLGVSGPIAALPVPVAKTRSSALKARPTRARLKSTAQDMSGATHAPVVPLSEPAPHPGAGANVGGGVAGVGGGVGGGVTGGSPHVPVAHVPPVAQVFQ